MNKAAEMTLARIVIPTTQARPFPPPYAAVRRQCEAMPAQSHQPVLHGDSGLVASMSGKGNCYDNAPMESFWGTLKTEHVFHRQYETRQQAMREITEYIEIFYNRQRRQKQLGYLAPAVFERQFYELQLAA